MPLYDENSYVCLCREGFTGKNCQTSKELFRDLLQGIKKGFKQTGVVLSNSGPTSRLQPIRSFLSIYESHVYYYGIYQVIGLFDVS